MASEPQALSNCLSEVEVALLDSLVGKRHPDEPQWMRDSWMSRSGQWTFVCAICKAELPSGPFVGSVWTGIVQHGRMHLEHLVELVRLAEVLCSLGWDVGEAVAWVTEEA